MTTEPQAQYAAPEEILRSVSELKRRCDWEAIAAHAPEVPPALEGSWFAVADEVGFALGQLQRTDEAAELFERVYEAKPSRRAASALAYVYYDALLRRRSKDGPERSKEADRQAFTRWIRTALSHDPRSLTDLYRLGVFEAQVESCHDKAALRAFLAAIAAYREIPDGDERHQRLRKHHVKAHYAGARSALRLRDLDCARKLAFDCIREGEGTDHVEPVHKLYLAGKVCAALHRDDHAERAFRKALDAKGPPHRDYIYGALAQVALRTGCPDDAARWIDDNVPPHRRKPVLWRLVGDVKVAQGREQEALLAFQNALRKDRAGRHLTLTALGELQLRMGKPGKAETSFRQALDFRRRRYLSVHRPALDGLARALEAQGKAADAVEARAQLEADLRGGGSWSARQHGGDHTGPGPVSAVRDQGGEVDNVDVNDRAAGGGQGGAG
jgi:tetratricopeptide (TPR) repeat protein